MSGVTHLLIHTVTLERATRVYQGGGRYKETRLPIIINVKFRVSGLSSQDSLLAGRQEITATHNGYGEPDLDIRYDDVIIRQDTGERYRVIGDIKPSLPHHRKVLLEEIKQGA